MVTAVVYLPWRTLDAFVLRADRAHVQSGKSLVILPQPGANENRISNGVLLQRHWRRLISLLTYPKYGIRSSIFI